MAAITFTARASFPLDGVAKLRVAQDQRLDGGCSRDRGGRGPAVEHPDLAKEVSRAQALPPPSLDVDLDLAAQHNVKGVRRLPLGEERAVGRDAHLVHARGQELELMA